MKFIIEEQDAQSILNYLATKPFQEVFNLIPVLQNLKKVEEESKDVVIELPTEEAKEELCQTL